MAEQHNTASGTSGLSEATGGMGLSTLQRIAPGAPSRQVLAVFWRQMALLISVGVSLVRALHQVAERTSHMALRRVIQQVAASIEAGMSFSEALLQHPTVFSRLTVQIIQVAEQGGVLDDSVRLVADELERYVEIRGKVRRALAYPVTILLMGVVVVVFVMVWVIPEFSVVFSEQNVSLPLPTRIVMGIAHVTTSYWWLLLLILVALVAVYTAVTRMPYGRLLRDRYALRLPLVGDLLAKAHVLRFAQTFGTLLHGGVPILVALKLVQEHAENSALAMELEQAYIAVDQGSRLEMSLRQSTIFPPLAVDILSVGEEAGQLDTVLFRLAEIYKEEVDQSVSLFASVLEPFMLMLMGLMVALIVWAVYLPYFNLPGLLD